VRALREFARVPSPGMRTTYILRRHCLFSSTSPSFYANAHDRRPLCHGSSGIDDPRRRARARDRCADLVLVSEAACRRQLSNLPRARGRRAEVSRRMRHRRRRGHARQHRVRRRSQESPRCTVDAARALSRGRHPTLARSQRVRIARASL